MKKQILLLLAVLLTATAFAQAQEKKSNPPNNYYSYSPNGIENFKLSEEQIIIKFSPGISFEQQADIFKSEMLLQPLTKEMILPSPVVTIAKINGSVGVEKLKALLKRLEQHNIIEYANPFLIYKDGTNQGITDRFMVKLRSVSDATMLQNMVAQNGLQIVEQYKYDAKVYSIKVAKTTGFNALEMANKFYESGKFSASEPDFLLLLKTSNMKSPFLSEESTTVNTNDTFLDYQWSLNNTGSTIQYSGTPGSDMNVFAAWGISTGSAAIKVAILDEGVDLVHPDLIANLLPGFDATGLDSGGAPSNNDAHGTACAGIVAAVGNNNLGVSGIAYNCKIIPVRIAYSNTSGDWVSTNLGIGTALDWAWQTGGADVLSNSWGGGSNSSLINDAIDRAVTQGRGGLGAPVIFAAGNDNGAVSYPATLPNVISVTAMSMCDQRKSKTSCDGETWWGSNYGTNTDVSAPGVKIYTCDISGSAGYSAGDYTATFNGTSSACPNIAGVMALLLSTNSSLSMVEARQILESTCNKVGGYPYTNNISGQPNGSWSTDLGYGRVNALAALQLATVVCTSPPVAGTAVASTTFSCAPTSVSLSLDGVTYSMGQTYQWQSSTDNSIWTIIPDATLASYSIIVSTSTYFRCLVTCSGITSDGISTLVTIDTTGHVTAVGGGVESICLGESITLSVSNGANYSWSPATGLNQTTGSTVVANPTITTVYTITSTSDGGCISTTTITVNVNPLPLAAVISSNSPLNAGETLNLTAEVAAAEGYVLNSTSVSFIDISTSGSPISGISDDSRHFIIIPAFTFNAVEYTTALVCSNGFLVFGATSTGSANYSNLVLPTNSFSTSGSNAAVCAFWDDLLPTTGTSIVTETIGNVYIVQWNMIKQYSSQSGSETTTFQIQLNLATGQINIVYPDVFFNNPSADYGASATIGLNYSATSALQYSFNTASLQNGQSLTFTPKAYSFLWTGPNDYTSTELNPSVANVTQNATGSYSLQLTSESGCSVTSQLEVTVTGLSTTTYYADADADGFGNAAISLEASVQPEGYVLDNTDCDDTEETIYPGATEINFNTIDENCDGSLFNGHAPVVVDLTTPSGNLATFTTPIDCSVATNTGGFSGADVTYKFKVTKTNAPASIAYVSSSSPSFNLLLASNMAYSSTYDVQATAIVNGEEQPYNGNTRTYTTLAGVFVDFIYTTTNCGVTSFTVTPSFYCTTPNVGSSTLGYRFKIQNMTTLATVTVDRTVPNANLGMTTIAAYETTYTVNVAAIVDGVEQPYSGDCTVTTPGLPLNKVVDNQCGSTLAALNSTINVPVIVGAQNYRFRVAESTAPGTTEVITSPFPSFRLSSLTQLSLNYGKTYLVEVQSDIINNGVAGTSAYGQVCNISTPSVVSISASTNNCGGSLEAINSRIFVNGVPGANQYTYRVALASSPTVYNDIVSPFTNFRLTSLTTVPLLHNEVYNIQVNVRVNVGGTDYESGFGSVCTYTTPAGPTSEVQLSQCGDELGAYQVPSNTTSIVATFVSGGSYRFKLEQYSGATLLYSEFITRPVSNFTLSMFPGLTPDSEYSVSVAVDYYGVGEYGKDCTIKTPQGVIARTIELPFSAVGYPNPFADNFKLEVTSNSASVVSVKVYDMLGRLVEQKQATVNELETTTIGERYPSGVYNVIVTQDDETSTLRVVKR